MKEYHFGVVAYFDDDTATWEFQVSPINGDDSPFAEMSWGEVYDNEEGDVADPGWQFAIMDSDDPVESANYIALDNAMRHAQHRLREPQ
jgi:hypothetical protein